MSVYIHIPFCANICSYCDFAKVFYNEKLVDDYLDQLEKEIKSMYKQDNIDTIYIGGGTPSCLNKKQLKKLFNIIKIFKINKNFEFTFECNVENTTLEKLKLLKANGVNRLSIGVQSFNDENLKFLNRLHNKEDVFTLIKEAKEVGFNNISIDLIYGIPNQTLNSLKNDLNAFVSLNINHISSYSLIVEEHTKLYIDKVKNIDQNLDYKMYQFIQKILKVNGFSQYEISNFSKPEFESKHNLVYWNNNHYYGFGVGASGYIENKRYDNTKSLTKYLKSTYLKEEIFIDENTKIQNELILGFRKIKGINKREFYLKYKKNIENCYNIKDLITENKLMDDGYNLYVNQDYLYLLNEILINFI